MKRPRPFAMRYEFLCRTRPIRDRRGALLLLSGCLGMLLMGVAGSVAAQGCQILLSQPVIEFGQVNRTQLQKHGNQYLFAAKHLQLTVQCSRRTDMLLNYLAAGTYGDSYGFGERGQYSMQLSDAQLDGQPVMLGAARDPRGPWMQKGDRIRWVPGMQVTPLLADVALQGTNFTARLTIQGWLDAASNLSNADELHAGGVLEVDGATAALALQASVVPAACKLFLGHDGVVDFGLIEPGQLSAGKTTTLRRSLPAAVTCDGLTRFALRAVDNRQPGLISHVKDVARSALFGAGKKTSDGLAWSLQLEGPALGDGQVLQPLYSPQSGAGWQPGPGAAFFHNDGRLLGFALSNRAAAGPALIRQLEAMLMVELYIAPLRQLDLRDETAVDGAATLEIVYL